MRRVKLDFPLSPDSRLVRWANSISVFYGHPVYLVGSQLTGKQYPSDIDLVCPIPDEEFDARYGDLGDWLQEGGTGIYTDVRWDWANDCHKRSIDGMLSTKRVIDFKVQPFAQWFGYSYLWKEFPPVQVSTRPESKMKAIYFHDGHLPDSEVK